MLVYETTNFDYDFINHVKKLRKLKQWSQEELSLRMGVAKTFVGNVESYTQRQKYSTRHIALLAKAFGFENISDFMKFPTPENDKIRVTVKHTMNDACTKVMNSEVIKIEAI